MKYVISYRGGVGDVLLAYLREGSEAGYVAALRGREPGAFVRCALMATTPDACNLFAGGATFDELVARPWDGDGLRFAAEAFAGFAQVPRSGEWRRPWLPLHEDELALSNDLEAGGGFVALHPYAGTPNRRLWGNVDVPEIVDAIAVAGNRVVVLGGSCSRRQGRGTVEELTLHESCTIAGNRVLNLVGRASLRLQAHLASRARRFVGSFSAFFCGALACGVPSFVVAPPDLRDFFAADHPTYGRLAARDGSPIAYFGEGGVPERVGAWCAQP